MTMTQQITPMDEDVQRTVAILVAITEANEGPATVNDLQEHGLLWEPSYLRACLTEAHVEYETVEKHDGGYIAAGV